MRGCGCNCKATHKKFCIFFKEFKKLYFLKSCKNILQILIKERLTMYRKLLYIWSMDEVKKRHKQFAKNVVSGMSQTDAYSAVYPKASRASCGVKGSQLIKNDEVKRHISYFLNKKGLKRQDLIGKMAQIVGDVEHKDCFNAIKLGLELHGDLKGEEGGPKVNINYNVNNDQLNSAIEKITNMTNKLRDLEGYPSGQIYETEDAEIIE